MALLPDHGRAIRRLTVRRGVPGFVCLRHSHQRREIDTAGGPQRPIVKHRARELSEPLALDLAQEGDTPGQSTQSYDDDEGDLHKTTTHYYYYYYYYNTYT